MQITLHPQHRHQLFRNEPPIFDDFKVHLTNRLYYLLKIINILALAAPQLRKRISQKLFTKVCICCATTAVYRPP